jgi:two-component system response regulator BaeR
MDAATQAYVLVVEDDAKISQLLVDYLHSEGLQARVVKDGQMAVDQITKARPSLVLLDLMLPGLDGISVCRAVRLFSDVPIIMLTARIDEVDRMLGLDTGADDYVCKPFSPREVMSRVKAQLRRAEGRLATIPLPWVIDDDKLRISWRGHWLVLTVLEFRMLRMLLRQPGRVFSRAQLLDSMHADNHDTSDRVIDSHVKNLRRKIQACDAAFNAITSIYGVGYCFDAPESGLPK